MNNNKKRVTAFVLLLMFLLLAMPQPVQAATTTFYFKTQQEADDIVAAKTYTKDGKKYRLVGDMEEKKVTPKTWQFAFAVDTFEYVGQPVIIKGQTSGRYDDKGVWYPITQDQITLQANYLGTKPWNSTVAARIGAPNDPYNWRTPTDQASKAKMAIGYKRPITRPIETTLQSTDPTLPVELKNRLGGTSFAVQTKRLETLPDKEVTILKSLGYDTITYETLDVPSSGAITSSIRLLDAHNIWKNPKPAFKPGDIYQIDDYVNKALIAAKPIKYWYADFEPITKAKLTVQVNPTNAATPTGGGDFDIGAPINPGFTNQNPDYSLTGITVDGEPVNSPPDVMPGEDTTVVFHFQYNKKPVDPMRYTSKPTNFAELKEGTPDNETFNAMAGVPSTKRLYLGVGGSEFIVDVELEYKEKVDSVWRTYRSHYGGTACEYKARDNANTSPRSLGGQTVDLHDGGSYNKTWSGSIPNDGSEA